MRLKQKTFKYQTYTYVLFPVPEPTEERLKRGDWRSRIVGWRIARIISPEGRIKPYQLDFPDLASAKKEAENMIDQLNT